MNTLRVYCGCGYLADTLKVAQDHANETGHAMTIQGSVTPDTRDYPRPEKGND